MQQPNPWILLMGGIALLNVAMAMGGLHLVAWAKYGLMGLVGALGVASISLGVSRYFKKKPERQRYQPKHVRRVELPRPPQDE